MRRRSMSVWPLLVLGVSLGGAFGAGWFCSWVWHAPVRVTTRTVKVPEVKTVHLPAKEKVAPQEKPKVDPLPVQKVVVTPVEVPEAYPWKGEDWRILRSALEGMTLDEARKLIGPPDGEIKSGGADNWTYDHCGIDPASGEKRGRLSIQATRGVVKDVNWFRKR